MAELEDIIKGWLSFFLIPSVPLLITGALAAVLFSLGSPGLGILTLLGGAIIFVGELAVLIKSTGDIVGI